MPAVVAVLLRIAMYIGAMLAGILGAKAYETYRNWRRDKERMKRRAHQPFKGFDSQAYKDDSGQK